MAAEPLIRTATADDLPAIRDVYRRASLTNESDREWIEAGSRRTAFYTNIPPGRYTFRVKAANNDGVWNEDGARLVIVVTPPFWATVWFRLALGGGAVALEVGEVTTRATDRGGRGLRLDFLDLAGAGERGGIGAVAAAGDHGGDVRAGAQPQLLQRCRVDHAPPDMRACSLRMPPSQRS